MSAGTFHTAEERTEKNQTDRKQTGKKYTDEGSAEREETGGKHTDRAQSGIEEAEGKHTEEAQAEMEEAGGKHTDEAQAEIERAGGKHTEEVQAEIEGTGGKHTDGAQSGIEEAGGKHTEEAQAGREPIGSAPEGREAAEGKTEVRGANGAGRTEGGPDTGIPAGGECGKAAVPEELLRPGERLDDLQNGYWMIQDNQGFCYGLDAVLLSAFARVKPGEKALDLCTGTGIVPVLLRAKTRGKHFTGLEIQEKSVDMARRSVRCNRLEKEIEIVLGDVKCAQELFGASAFQVVTCNPPYMTAEHGLVNPHLPKAIARHEVLCTLEDVVSQAAAVLEPKGRFYMVHRPFRLAEIMGVMMKYRLEPKRMRLVYPFADREPNMVLIEGLKGGNPRITVEKPLIVYERPGVYTQEIREMYGDGR